MNSTNGSFISDLKSSTGPSPPADGGLQDLVDTYGSIVGSVICALGFFTSLISVVVFAQSELSAVIFKYYLTESILNTLSAFINIFLVWYNKYWGISKPYDLPDQVSLWSLIFFDLVTNFCTFGSSILNIAISLDRYLSVINKRNIRLLSWKHWFRFFMVIMVALSFLCSAPRPLTTAAIRFLLELHPDQRPRLTAIHNQVKWVQTVLETFVRDVGLFVVLIIVNVCLSIALKRFVSRKKTVVLSSSSTEQISEIDVTKMAIVNTLVYLIGRVGSLLYRTMILTGLKVIGYFKPVQYISLGLSYLLNIFIYYYFNKAFKKNFWQLFGRLRTKARMKSSSLSSRPMSLQLTKLKA